MALLAALMLLAACQYDGIVSNIREDMRGNDSLAISFGNGVIDAPVRTRSLAMLSEHTSTMGVWGWQTTKVGVVGCLFRDQEVTFNSEIGLWSYSPEKYWEEGSSYRFYAYAPHGNSVPNANVAIDEETGHISITGVTLSGSNTMSTNARAKLYGTFKNVDDIDWMIDRTGRLVPKEQIRNKVIFNMQHILAKFNVKVNTSSSISATSTYVVLDSISIGRFLSKADFSQILDHSPIMGNADDEAAQEWQIDSSNPLYTLQGTRYATVDKDGCYVIESLLIPQNVNESQMVKISYTLHFEDARTEHYTYNFNLNQAFNSFNCSYNYTLYITIGPDVITFDAGSDIWENEWESNQWIK